MLPIVVHFSNKTLLPKFQAVKGTLPRSVVVSRESLDTVVGTLFGKRIRDNRLYLRSTTKKFSTARSSGIGNFASKVLFTLIKIAK
jgi:hypothetical protein